MRLPIRWLRDYIPLDEGASEVAARLESAGFEVESIETFGAGCKGLVVGRVEEFEPHPNAEKLRLCKVAYGDGAQAEVVCGASNFDAGDLVAFAPSGSELPGGVIVETRTIKGIRSNGMICSEAELGVGNDAEGILVLQGADSAGASGIEVGAPLEEILGLGDAVIDVDTTPNRPDAMSVLGLARELSASTGVEFAYPGIVLEESGPAAAEKITVEIQEPERCPRYIARYIEGVKVGASPPWMALRLREAGARPINNIVDITNFVLLEVGHPLHAFDYLQVTEGRIVVRLAASGEELITLDGERHELAEDDLVVADAVRALAVAGVVGGEGSGVSTDTTEVLLESAYFEPRGILRTAKRHGIRTESSARFERGCDPEGAMWASRRAAGLMAELASGRVGSEAVDAYPRPIRPARVRLSTRRTNRLLGTDISADRQAELLSSIGLSVKRGQEEFLDVEVPTFRPDLTRDVDLIEEVGRLYGYDRVEKTLPESGARIGRLDRTQRVRRAVAEIVRGCGFTSVKNFSMVSPDEIPASMAARSTRLANPLRREESVLRPTLIPGVLRCAGRNLARRRRNLRLFEVGTVFGAAGQDGIPDEHRSLGGVVVSAEKRVLEQQSGIGDIAGAPEFYEAKGVLDAVLEAGRIAGVEYRPSEIEGMHPGRSAVVVLDGHESGIVSEVLPETAAFFDIDAAAAVFEVDLDRVCELFAVHSWYVEFSRYPPVFFDLSFVVAEEVPATSVVECVRSAGSDLVERCEVLDVFRSPKLGEGLKSVTVSIAVAALDRTLTDEEAAPVRARIVSAVSERLGAELRGA